MDRFGVWATDVEIFATAGLLRTDIQVFSGWGNTGEWQRFAAREANPECKPEERSIYIDLRYNHFTYVINVGQHINA